MFHSSSKWASGPGLNSVPTFRGSLLSIILHSDELVCRTDLVDVQEVAGVGLGALVDATLLRPDQEEVVREGIEPDGRTRA